MINGDASQQVFPLPVLDALIVISVSAATALSGLWWFGRGAPRCAPLRKPGDPPIELLFQSGVLHHASPIALSRFGLVPGAHDWKSFRDRMEPGFPDLPETFAEGLRGRTFIEARDPADRRRIELEWEEPNCWVRLLNDVTATDTSPEEIARIQHRAEILQKTLDSAPHPIWQETCDRQIIWRNAAYDALLARRQGSDEAKPLFDPDMATAQKRVKLVLDPAAPPDWYDITCTATADSITIYHATCVSAVAEAELAQRNFVQTLAKTFAHLSIGLAIFDRKGQLALFNPALVDLTSLPAEFLAARPTILSFFDQLRENRRMPEPKDYFGWRQKIAGVIAAATDGRYEETWSLESGQTYSVKGRPHPDGAIAFLIEDISAEVALTRNYRAELEMGQALLDVVEDGFAVFSSSGIMMFCNAAYRTMWDLMPESTFVDITVADSVAIWRRGTTTPAPWEQVETQLLDLGGPRMRAFRLRLTDERVLTCEVRQIVPGMTLARFRGAAGITAPENPGMAAAE